MVEALQIELRYTNYIETEDLDVRHVPSKENSLFVETALRLERVFEKVGIEKKVEEVTMKPRKEIKNNKFFWVLALGLALFLGLVEKW